MTKADIQALVARLRKTAEQHGMLLTDPPQPSTMKALLDEAAAALSRTPGEAVAVKPLEWRGEGTLYAESVVGAYGVWRGYYRVPGEGPGRPAGDTIESAKSAAQADYDARIRSALHPAPATAPRAIAAPAFPGQAFLGIDPATGATVQMVMMPGEDGQLVSRIVHPGMWDAALSAATAPALCEDEGCPHHGTPHVCVTAVPTPNNLPALEKAWQNYAEGACGWSGAIPPWFADAIAAYVRYTVK